MDVRDMINVTNKQMAEIRKVLPATIDHRINVVTDFDGNIIEFKVLPDTIMPKLEKMEE